MSAPASQFTLGEIAERLKGELLGPADRLVKSVRPITAAGSEDITFLDQPKYLPLASQSKAGAIIVSRATRPLEGPALERHALEGPALIFVDQPYVAFAQLLELFFPRRRAGFGVSPQATVGEGSAVGAGSNIYPGAYLGNRVRIGDETDIFPGTCVGDDVAIGSHCVLYPNVTIYQGCRLGDRVIIHAGAVIGADGFGYVQKQNPDNPGEPVVHYKIPQVGIVVIEDDVEVGANATVDRAALEVTRIGRGTKIDNLVMVAHNCQIGCHGLLVSQAGISGSTTIGNYVTIAGQAGLVGHIRIGDRVTIGAQAGVTKSVPDGQTVLGSPAFDAGRARRALALFEHLPEYRRKLEELDRRLQKLEREN
ncbi:MAG: UDP-3-O-(3-hydroxymyristoyl)glucosamine N-acyltransferase [Planctomycetes bacterium]|nr:UDP-3-O-(3-hydroxymyristoyl)glucosamine N-acyltransferase [Planctomycetota bacterium]